MEIEKEITEKLKIDRIRAMKNPVILMNTEDFEALKTELENTVTNFKVGDFPTFANVPIKHNKSVEKGTFRVYDIPPPW